MLYLGIGTNLGDRRKQMLSAISEIENRVGHIVAQSDFFETLPWGFESDNTFLNSAVAVETALSPLEVLAETQGIEKSLGRTVKSAGGEYHDRTIDIDILLYDDLILSLPQPSLIIPHPLMHLRRFVLDPLAQIAPDLIVPGMGKTIIELQEALNANSL